MSMYSELNKTKSNNKSYKHIVLLVLSIAVSIVGFLFMLTSVVVSIKIKEFDPMLLQAILDNYKFIPADSITPDIQAVMQFLNLYQWRVFMFIGGVLLVIMAFGVSMLSKRAKEVG